MNHYVSDKYTLEISWFSSKFFAKVSIRDQEYFSHRATLNRRSINGAYKAGLKEIRKLEREDARNNTDSDRARIFNEQLADYENKILKGRKNAQS